MKLYDSGVYLVNGKEIMTDATEGTAEDGKSCHKRDRLPKIPSLMVF